MKNIFDTGAYLKMTFFLQLPYLYDNGTHRIVYIQPMNARNLVQDGIVKYLVLGDKEFCLLTPIVPAEQNCVFQVGSPPV